MADYLKWEEIAKYDIGNRGLNDPVRALPGYYYQNCPRCKKPLDGESGHFVYNCTSCGQAIDWVTKTRISKAEQMHRIDNLSAEKQQYLYGKCTTWCLENYKEGLEIVALMESSNRENGIVHSYLKNPETGLCYDVRGESDCDEDIVAYTDTNYFSNSLEEYIFESIEDFEIFLKWVDFEIIRENYLVR